MLIQLSTDLERNYRQSWKLWQNWMPVQFICFLSGKISNNVYITNTAGKRKQPASPNGYYNDKLGYYHGMRKKKDKNWAVTSP